jgi:hypothetical protein
MAVSIHRTRSIETLDVFGFMADVLAGLNVRHYNYVAEVIERNYDAYAEELTFAPFAVFIYDDGMDYNEDGTAYMDDYPGDWLHSCFNSRRGAEMEACWLERHGVASNRITIVEGHWLADWEAKSHPIKD